jgi:serine/threonine protein kinase
LKILINSIESVIPDSSLQKIGQGGEGVIYLITLNGQKFAVKKYYKPNENLHKKVKAMLDKAPEDSVQKINSQTFIQLAWPIGLCYDGSGFCGFVMPYVDLNHTNTLDFYLDPRLFKEKFGSGNLSLTFKIEIARNLAGVVKLLHSKGHFFIDFKPQNVRVYDRYHLISLIDCDGFSIEGATGERFPANGFSSEYIYPEALQKNKRPQELSIKQDLFALSVVIFQLLNYGIHPFSGIITLGDTATTTDDKVSQGYYPYGLNLHPRIKPLNFSAHNFLPSNLRVLFDKAFTLNSSYPPKVDEWIHEFEDIISNQKLQKCLKHPTKPDHIHFSGHECMACMRDQIVTNIRVKTPPIKSNSTSATSNQGINQHSTSKTPVTFWDKFQKVAIGLVIFIIFMYFISFLGNQNNNQSKVSTTTQNNIAAPNMLINNFLGTWSTTGVCNNKYVWIAIDRDRKYSINIIDKSDSNNNYSLAVISFSTFENYALESGKSIKNVVRFNIDSGSVYDIGFIGSPEKTIKVYRLDRPDQLVISQGKVIKDATSTPSLKKCN